MQQDSLPPNNTAFSLFSLSWRSIRGFLSRRKNRKLGTLAPEVPADHPAAWLINSSAVWRGKLGSHSIHLGRKPWMQHLADCILLANGLELFKFHLVSGFFKLIPFQNANSNTFTHSAINLQKSQPKNSLHTDSTPCFSWFSPTKRPPPSSPSERSRARSLRRASLGGLKLRLER